MVAVPLGLTTYRRRGARTAEVSLVNVLVEKDPTNQIDGKVFIQRPGLALYATVGYGPIRGEYHKLGSLGSFRWVVSGSSLYKVDIDAIATYIGAIPGTDLVTMDGSTDRLIIGSDAKAYSTDGVTVAQVNMPGNVDVSSVVCLNGYFILPEADSDRFYWLAPGDVDPDPLNFASAEAAPDNIVRAERLRDELWFLGQSTNQVFQPSGNVDAPFTPIPGRVDDKGCANKNSVTRIDNTLFWVGNDFIIYRADTTPVRISDHSMEERLRVAGADNLRAFALAMDGHTIYVLRCGDIGTFAFDVENGDWPRWKTYGRETWRAHVGTQTSGDLIIVGDDTEGKLWRLDTTISNDDGDILEREVTGGLPIVGQPQKCASFSVAVATGWAPITGTAINPRLMMRYSDDGGDIWSSWIEIELGKQGKYATQAIWRRLGLMRAPGRIFTIRMTDDAPFRIHYARANDAVNI